MECIVIIKRHSRKFSGFTLIEMLAAIAIIAILVVMAFLSINRMWAHAQSVTCLSNLRQIYVYLQAYAIENDGYLPKVWDSTSQKQWNITLCEKVGAPDITLRKNFSLWHCPSWGPTASDCFPAHPSYSVNFSYGLTLHSSSTLPPDRLINLPSTTILLADTLYDPTPPSPTPWQAYFFIRGIPATSQMIHLRHNHRANAIFADGHATSLDEKGVLDTGVITVSKYGWE